MAAARQILEACAANIIVNSSDSDTSENDEERQPGIEFQITEISERLLFQRTRLNRNLFTYVLNLISPALTRNTRSGRFHHLTPMHKLYVTLQFYASGSYQWLVGSSGRISQSSVSGAITEVTTALVALAPQFIRFPNNEDYPTVKQAFYQLGMMQHGRGMPNVLGLIDCTHIRIRAPSNAPEQYLNRHIYYSINVQLVVGPDLKIYDAFAQFPGSNHDSYIWRNSALRERLAQGLFPEGWLIGDSGYPLEPWLMTPVGQITTPAEQLYNAVHISTRNPVERTNGVLKSRWHVLDSALAYDPGKVCGITVACCVLHNICTEHNLDVEELQEYPLDQVVYEGAHNPNYENLRQNLINTNFRP